MLDTGNGILFANFSRWRYVPLEKQRRKQLSGRLQVLFELRSLVPSVPPGRRSLSRRRPPTSKKLHAMFIIKIINGSIVR
jgi:hypothetical protein